MADTIAGMRPDPRVRHRQLNELLAIYDNVVRWNEGYMVFLAGEQGSGRRSTLRAMMEVLDKKKPNTMILAGRIGADGYTPLNVDQTDYSRRIGQLGALLELPAQLIGPVAGPVLGLAALSLQAGAATLETIKPIDQTEYQIPRRLVMLLKQSLREAARQGPVVWVIHGLDAAEADFLNSIFVTSAQELLQDRRLLIVATLNGPQHPGPHQAGETTIMYTARSLLRRGLASWMFVPRLSEDDVAAWLGDVDPGLARHLYQVTVGNPDWLAQLWNDLWQRKKVRLHPDTYRWELAPGYTTSDLGMVNDIFVERLRRLLGDEDVGEHEDVLFMLACAALEGQEFTAIAVAEVMGWDQDDLIDLLDDVLLKTEENPDGLVEEAAAVRLDAFGGGAVWRYRFAAELFWYTLERYGMGKEDRVELSGELAKALAEVFAADVQQVARKLARLFRASKQMKQAQYYDGMASYVAQAEGAYLQAQLLMTTDKEGWSQEDYAWTARALNEATNRLYRRVPFSELLPLAMMAYECATDGNVRESQIHASNMLGLVYIGLGDIEKAMRYNEEALLHVKQTGDRDWEATMLNNIGGVYLSQGMKNEALRHFEQSLVLRERTRDLQGKASTLANISSIHRSLMNYREALRYLEMALPLKEQAGDRIGEATTLTAMGLIYQDLDEKKEAMRYYDKALAIFTQIGDSMGEATALNNIGSVYSDLKMYEDALQYYEKALALRNQIGDRYGEASSLNNVGTIYSALGEKQQALQYYEKSLALSREVRDHEGEARALLSIGGIYLDMGNMREVLRYLNNALSIYEQIGDTVHVKIVGGMIQKIKAKQRSI